MTNVTKTRSQREEELVHLVRLGWDLRDLGVSSSLLLPVDGTPALEITTVAETPVRVRAVRGANGWGFSWREGAWVRAFDEGAAEAILRVVAS
ncbi:hypothetical protein [Streptosporangium carneum]|uniref:Uncharacterized protein n=1 Tax=Streptosporangium carneum TaxID=47481 RepID=A0A9W6MGQ7_9ACTN|nr:hypothetical protein [Streptosporangium carneum]GLK13153.1 hypothetical protein GCM10017600_65640 [Streptosporangium carneum]